MDCMQATPLQLQSLASSNHCKLKAHGHDAASVNGFALHMIVTVEAAAHSALDNIQTRSVTTNAKNAALTSAGCGTAGGKPLLEL